MKILLKNIKHILLDLEEREARALLDAIKYIQNKEAQESIKYFTLQDRALFELLYRGIEEGVNSK